MSKQFEKLLAFHCSPALFGIKPSNLMNVSLKDFPNIDSLIEELNNSFSKVSFELMKITKTSALILVYKKTKLSNAIFKKDNYDYLLSNGYPENKELNSYLNLLKERLKTSDFPHEIGVFLGYDLDDIKEYKSGNKNCLLVGYWKVFSKKEEKEKIFDQYTRCKNIVSSLLNKGYNLNAIA